MCPDCSVTIPFSVIILLFGHCQGTSSFSLPNYLWMLLQVELCPSERYVEVATPSTSKCDLWNQVIADIRSIQKQSGPSPEWEKAKWWGQKHRLDWHSGTPKHPEDYGHLYSPEVREDSVEAQGAHSCQHLDFVLPASRMREYIYVTLSPPVCGVFVMAAPGSQHKYQFL